MQVLLLCTFSTNNSVYNSKNGTMLRGTGDFALTLCVVRMTLLGVASWLSFQDAGTPASHYTMSHQKAAVKTGTQH